MINAAKKHIKKLEVDELMERQELIASIDEDQEKQQNAYSSTKAMLGFENSGGGDWSSKVHRMEVELNQTKHELKKAKVEQAQALWDSTGEPTSLPTRHPQRLRPSA